MNYLVSIIIPMYNAEKYIKRCIESIIGQTYINIEIIIIDDGSTDNSLEIVNGIRDKRIKIYSKSNGGVSSARNLGIEKANGEFFLFVDSDDYVDLKIVEELISKVAKENTFVFCNNDEIWKNRVDERILFKGSKGNLTRNDVMKEIASGSAGLVCSKLVSSKVIKENNIKFDDKLVIGEDQIFFLQVSEKTNKFQYVNKSLYHYDRRNEDSATLKYQENLYYNFSRLQEQVKSILERNNLNSDEYKRILNNKSLDFTWVCINNEVNNVNFIQAIENIEHILHLVEKDINYDMVHKSKINQLIIKSIKNPSKLYIIKMIFFIKLLNIKVNLINRGIR